MLRRHEPRKVRESHKTGATSDALVALAGQAAALPGAAPDGRVHAAMAGQPSR